MSIRELFNSGNSISLFRTATDPYFQGLANILLGKHQEGLKLLEDGYSSDDELNLHKSFAYWCLGNKFEALALLNPSNLQHSKFKELINRRVRVLCQARNDGCPGWDITGVLKNNPDFDVLSIGSYTADDIHFTRFVDMINILPSLNWQPDFYFVHQVENKLVPYGLEHCDFPIIFHANDHKSDFPSCQVLLNLCDAFVTVGAQAHSEISLLSKAQVYTYPKMFAIEPEAIKHFIANVKELDLYYSGNIISTGLYDKAAWLLHFAKQVFGGRRNVHFTDQKLNGNEYYRNMSLARVVPTYIQQNQDSFSSRALEALACGSVAMVSKDNAISIYFNHNEGVVEFNPVQSKDVFEGIVSNWDNYYALAAKRGQQKAWQEFNHAKVIDHLFKFLAFISIKVPKRQIPPSSFRFTRAVDSNCPADPGYVDNCIDFLCHAEGYHDSLTLQSLHACRLLCQGKVGEALAVWLKVLESFPDDLLALFTVARIVDASGQRERAEEYFKRIINKDENLQVNKDFVFIPDDSFRFVHRLYLDEIINWLTDKKDFSCVRNIISSSACLFLSEICRDRGDQDNAIAYLRQSMAYQPDNFNAKVTYARFMADKDRNDAVNKFNRAISQYPGYYFEAIPFVDDALLAALGGDNKKSEFSRVWR